MKNKLRFWISSILTLSPAFAGLILWSKLPESMISHWGVDGAADGIMPKAFMVFGMPVILLMLNLLCIYITNKDQRSRGQSEKAINIVYWIMPIISLLVACVSYSSALGKSLNTQLPVALLLGTLFMVLGNYLPKVKQNNTFGIKIYWTLVNEENWNATHRFGGRLWFFMGFLTLIIAFIPFSIFVVAFIIILLTGAVAPCLYSYAFYRKQKSEGTFAKVETSSPYQRKWGKISTIMLALTVALVMIILLSGNIRYVIENNSLKIKATYYTDITVNLKDIDSIELISEFDKGTRTNGFGSPRLSLGTFENNELGTYTLYSYTETDRAIVLKDGESILVLTAENNAETEKLYNNLKKKVY